MCVCVCVCMCVRVCVGLSEGVGGEWRDIKWRDIKGESKRKRETSRVNIPLY